MVAKWKQYQEDAAGFFRSMRVKAETDFPVKGARGKHKLDVFVKGAIHGIKFKWVIECKAWKTNVSKEKVLALISIVQDVGADRGFLLSEKGFQSGAIRVARSTNITLTSIADLRETVKDEILTSSLANLTWRANNARQVLWKMHKASEEFMSHFMNPLAELHILLDALDDAKSEPYPFIYKVEKSGARTARHLVNSLEELVVKAEKVIRAAEAYARKYRAQRRRVAVNGAHE